MTQLSTNEMRSILTEQIDGLRAGTATAATVNAISNAVGKILSSLKLEIEYHKMIGKRPNIKAMLSEPEAEAESK